MDLLAGMISRKTLTRMTVEETLRRILTGALVEMHNKLCLFDHMVGSQAVDMMALAVMDTVMFLLIRSSERASGGTGAT